MAGDWPSFCCFCQMIQLILTKQAWSIKNLLYGQEITPKNFAFAGTKWAFPSGQDRPILPARVANQKTGFASSFEEIWSARM